MKNQYFDFIIAGLLFACLLAFFVMVVRIESKSQENFEKRLENESARRAYYDEIFKEQR